MKCWSAWLLESGSFFVFLNVNLFSTETDESLDQKPTEKELIDPDAQKNKLKEKKQRKPLFISMLVSGDEPEKLKKVKEWKSQKSLG